MIETTMEEKDGDLYIDNHKVLRKTPFSGKQIDGYVCGIGLTMKTVEAIDQYGLEFPFSPKPKGVRYGRLGYCYYNARKLAEDRPKEFIFVQGLALLDDDNIWRGHGWCIDREGFEDWLLGDRNNPCPCFSIDNTWRTPGLRYIGIPIPEQILNK